MRIAAALMASVIGISTGCTRAGGGVSLSSSATFSAKDNKALKAQVLTDGALDKRVLVKGTPDSPFLITVGVDHRLDSTTSSSSSAEILFESKGGKLAPVGDWQMAGGGERPALRRESDKQIVVYYPIETKDQRSWVRFNVILEP